MPGRPVAIRRLRAADAQAYRAIRLEGLRDAPAAFGATFEQEAARPLAGFAERLEANFVLAASAGEEVLGTAGFRALDRAKERHKGALFGLYVRPAARRCGVGAALVAAILAHAADFVEQVQLAVGAQNAPARQLYAQLGFVAWGTERRALNHGGVYEDEVHMVKFLAEP